MNSAWSGEGSDGKHYDKAHDRQKCSTHFGPLRIWRGCEPMGWKEYNDCAANHARWDLRVAATAAPAIERDDGADPDSGSDESGENVGGVVDSEVDAREADGKDQQRGEYPAKRF